MLIVAHGDAGGEGSNTLAHELARRMSRCGEFQDVRVAFIRGEPTVEAAAAQIRSERLRVFPLFMSDGYYVRTAIPQRLGISEGVDVYGHRVVVDTALGVNPELPALLLAACEELAAQNKLDASQTTLLLVAHGSQKSSHSRDAAESVRSMMAGRGPFASVELALIEEEPYVKDMLLSLPRPLIVLGLLIGEGMHASDDVAGAIDALEDPEVFLVDRLGGYARIVEFIYAAVCCQR